MDATRWFETSTLSRSGRTHTYYALIKAGRWLYREHPDRTDPGSWDRQLVAGVDRARSIGLHVGELSKSLNAELHARPARRAAIAALQGTPDLVAADLLSRHPGMGVDRAAVRPAPRVRAAALDQALIGPDPRVISDEVWAKLMWAGLNLTDSGSPAARAPAGEREAVVSARARPRGRAALAVRRAACR